MQMHVTAYVLTNEVHVFSFGTIILSVSVKGLCSNTGDKDNHVPGCQSVCLRNL